MGRVDPHKGLALALSQQGDKLIMPCVSATSQIAAQIRNQAIMPAMIPRMAQGEPMPLTLDWAAKEGKAFDRT
jgi:hypothetical protein